jgi:aspartokinase/homoserine dehydrogenase 1
VRKTIILAREAGFPLEEAGVRIEPLISKRIAQAPTVETCMVLLPEMDAEIEARRSDAARHGTVLRYVSAITKEGASLSLSEYGPESPFFSLTGTDNMVVITSKRYSQNPLVIRGPGAGADVTAGGVFADILKTAESYL